MAGWPGGVELDHSARTEQTLLTEEEVDMEDLSSD